MSQRIVALVPMRHDSQRVAGKNYRSFAGRMLYRYIVDTLLECSFVDEIVIDTDSPVITEDVSQHYPGVKLLERPQHLRAGEVPMNDVLLHDTSMVQADYYIQTHSTNPLLRSETISRAIELFLENCPEYDSLFSVTRLQSRLWDGQAKAINHDPAVLLRTQDLPGVYEENSCIYIFSRAVLEARGNRIGEKPFMFEIDSNEAWDIDEELDFSIAEFLYTNTVGLKEK
ncbi:MAG: acylneuraminate cytidylyltransferase family protein [Planctomycetes bacterium]|nr:acylneuraminate cytidylyltransferase family protein [Planctomycetota bacterium]